VGLKHVVGADTYFIGFRITGNTYDIVWRYDDPDNGGETLLTNVGTRTMTDNLCAVGYYGGAFYFLDGPNFVTLNTGDADFFAYDQFPDSSLGYYNVYADNGYNPTYGVNANVDSILFYKSGDQGQPGEQGEQGIPGETTYGGPEGPTGPQGEQGVQGPTGATGPSGPSGASGASGPSGTSGPSGRSGPSGPSGPAEPKAPSKNLCVIM
jgi:hypothetical protein